MKRFNPITHPVCFTPPLRGTPSAWTGHVPFALYLMDLVRPRIFVELGTLLGTSYCAFCQAVVESGLATRCYAVDTWQGDAHTGPYGSEILVDLRTHHDPLYAGFSRLIQSTFDEALEQFEDGTIDLLHIDGYHTYEVVRHDFESWLPKLSEQGVLLLHDTNEHQKDFGVWKLFEELKEQYPYFEFLHEHGLGVLAVGRGAAELLRELVEASEQEQAAIRTFFSYMGGLLAREQQAQRDLTEVRAYTRDLFSQNETLHKELKAARAKASHLHQLHGGRLAEVIGGARYVLATEGPMATAKRTILWLGGKRSASSQSLAPSTSPAQPVRAEPPKE